MFPTAIAGSLPKPAWLAETQKLWPQWKGEGAELEQAKLDATLLWIKTQEDAGLDVVGDGEQARQHFVHGFLERVAGIDFEHKVEMGIRDDRYKAMVPQVVAPLQLNGRVHAAEARFLRAHTGHRIKFTLPGPMTIVDTVADRFYGDRVEMAMVFAELLNQEALALQADGVDIVQFDEPAFNVYMADAAAWGVKALERAARGLSCKTAVHICYGYGIQANNDWKRTLGQEWRQYEQVFPALAASSHRPGVAGVLPLARAARPDAPARRQGRHGRRDRRCQRRDRDARAGGRHHRPGAAVRRPRTPDPLHQLRPGADESRRGRSQAARAGCRRGTGARTLRRMNLPDRLSEERRTAPQEAAPVTPPPPLTALGDLDAQLASAGFAVLSAGSLFELTSLDAGTAARWAAEWDALPLDEHLRDGGRYRRRRHGCFVVEGPGVRAVPPRAHWQPVEYNALHGGIERWFEPLPAPWQADPAWTRLLAALAARASTLRGQARWFVEAHPFRIEIVDGIGRPTPEGAHRDGVDLVVVVLVARRNVKGGETRIFDVRGPQGMRFTLHEPWSALLLDDARVIHESTPIQPQDPDAAGWRDTLVLTFRRGGFQGPSA